MACSLNMNTEGVRTFRLGDDCDLRDEAQPSGEAQARYAGFMAGHRHNHTAVRHESIANAFNFSFIS